MGAALDDVGHCSLDADSGKVLTCGDVLSSVSIIVIVIYQQRGFFAHDKRTDERDPSRGAGRLTVASEVGLRMTMRTGERNIVKKNGTVDWACMEGMCRREWLQETRTQKPRLSLVTSKQGSMIALRAREI